MSTGDRGLFSHSLLCGGTPQHYSAANVSAQAMPSFVVPHLRLDANSRSRVDSTILLSVPGVKTLPRVANNIFFMSSRRIRKPRHPALTDDPPFSPPQR